MKINIGERITYFRNARGYTVNYLANQSGISQSYLRELEMGTYKNPSVDILSNLCDILGISLSEFFSTEQLPEIDQSLLEEVKQLSPAQREQLRQFLMAMRT